MKVILIRPPHHHMIRTNVPKSVEEETGMYPPLGLLYVAAGVQKWTNAEVELLDAPARGFGQKEIAEYISENKFDVAGVQTMTFNLVDAIKTVRTVKSTHKDIHITLGGPHVNLYPEETLSIEGADSLVLGEGERTFAEMINALEKDSDIADVSGVAVMRDGNVVMGQKRLLEEDLDDLPQPARNLIDNSQYWSVLAKSPFKSISSLASTRK